jgi:hypothetical protein
VFTQGGTEFNVEIIKSDDTVDMAGTHQVGDGVNDAAPVVETLQGEDFIKSMPGPRFVEFGFDREEDGMASLSLSSLDEGIAFKVAGETKNGGTGHGPDQDGAKVDLNCFP